jgi:hypothetical protein
MKTLFVSLTTVVVLTGCGETPQLNSAGKLDVAPHSGTGKAFVDPDWKQGDKTSWESHLKARAQYGQNDHSRTN